MDSGKALDVLEGMVLSDELERFSGPDRRTKAIIYRTHAGAALGLETGNAKARVEHLPDGRFRLSMGPDSINAAQTTLVLEARPRPEGVDWAEAGRIEGVRLDTKQLASTAYSRAIAPGKQQVARVANEEALRALVRWYGAGAPPSTQQGSALGVSPLLSASKDRPVPTNLILYGPPGTGKTYTSAREAVRLSGGDASGDEADVRAQYNALVAIGQVRFVTFHQSYAYEDFVEGLRPTTGEEGEQVSGGFRLIPVPGVFREIASVAEQAAKAAQGGTPYDIGKKQVFKMSLGRAGLEDYIFDAAIEGEYIVLGWGGEIDWTQFHSYEAIHARWNEDHPGTHGSDGNIAQVSRFRVDMKEGDLVIVSYGNSRYRAIGEITGPYEFVPSPDGFNRRRVRWLFVPKEPQPVNFYDKPFTMRSCYLLSDEHLHRDALALLLPGTGGTATVPKQFVLICDEINRANISKVFGELITLIEPDKRLGEINEIRVRLPYSGDSFGVPANLHIIGTMNTADRSIALIDKALRRRFVFREMMPKYNIEGMANEVDGAGVSLAQVLRTINDRIEFFLDREQQIGHAWVLGCDAKSKLDEVMRDKVIPLIAEYFFEDWSRIADVLGGQENNPFLLKTELQPPTRMRQEGTRTRWTVRDEFPADAYARLIGHG